MNRTRRRVYTGMAIAFPLFFLLHWNGLFSLPYYWVLEAMYGPQEVGSHPKAAFISAVIIFVVLALVFEATRAVIRPKSVDEA